MILVYVTHPDENHARDMVRTLLNERLIACSTFFPADSMYWWGDKICEEKEYITLMKSIPEKWMELSKRIEELHSYEVPTIIQINADSNPGYWVWLCKQLD